MFFKYKRFIIFFGVVSSIILLLFYKALLPQKKLPVFQPAMVNYELVDSTMQHIKKFHRIADFELINQNGKTVTHENFDGKIENNPFGCRSLLRLSGLNPFGQSTAKVRAVI